MESNEIDIEYLQQWVGRVEQKEEPLTYALVDRFNATFDFQPIEGHRVPLLIHFCLAQPIVATSDLGSDGHPERGGFLPPVPLSNRMWAGGEIVFHKDLLIGDTVGRRSVVKSVELKRGRSGLLCFVTVSHEIHVSGNIAIEEKQSIVYRRGSKFKRVDGSSEIEGEFVREVNFSPEMLFRYSAITFNSHRIHYDRPYATLREGYPGLVTHGPLQATLLCNLAVELRRGPPPRKFSFQSRSAIFDTDTISLHAASRPDAIVLSTSRKDGPVAMWAIAEWDSSNGVAE